MAVKKYRVYLEETTHGIADVEAEDAPTAASLAQRCKDVKRVNDVDLLAYEIVEIDENGEEVEGTRMYAAWPANVRGCFPKKTN